MDYSWLLLFVIFRHVAFETAVFWRMFFGTGKFLALSVAAETFSFRSQANMVVIRRDRDYRLQRKQVQYQWHNKNQQQICNILNHNQSYRNVTELRKIIK